ncbi:MAG: DUF87 domain-containing protein [Terrimicrobiaceae bacterium]
MAFDTDSFEKLGAFYLGRPYDLDSKTGADAPLLYKSRDLVTHAVCVGMTGSGKTGLCLALLEEAAIDGIPAIIIDPKGDLGNLMLTFPDLKPEDFLPWINPEDAARKNQTPEEFAAAQATLWREGLASWGQGSDRIRHLKEKAEVAIYTPGSTAGIPVNVLASFDAPQTRDPEELSDRAQTSAASLLGLLKIAADPIQSREGIFLSTLFTQAWQAGENLSLETIIERIQHPPFSKVGVLDLETFYPSKDRFALVMALNNILASPAFATWREGAPLDVAKALYTPEGKPRLAIFSIAHLGDDERMFFVSLLLNEVLSWTRAQSGTTSLRAILYMDEIFGYLPPSANPPSKRPMLTMLKQARAFGVGVVLATQNPVDLDYKALSNAGTWFIGRLQTERDKARVLDGLQGASSSGKFDRQNMESLLASLGNRVFLMNNVNDEAPTVFETRWVMSYLRGPLTRDQIRKLMEGRGQPRELATPPSPEASEPAESGGTRPPLPPAIPQVFVPSNTPSPNYRPMLIGAADLTYKDTKSGFETTQSVLLAAELPCAMTSVDWGSAETLDIPLSSLSNAPAEGASYEALPALATQAKSYTAWEKEFRAWLASSRILEVLTCTDPKAVSAPQETEGEFRARLALQIRESRDEAVEALRKKFAPRQAALQARLERANAALDRQKQQASAATMQTMISVGSSLLGAFLGKKAISATNIGRVTTAARGVGRSMKEGSESATAGQSLEKVQAQVAELETEFAAEAAALSAREPEFLKLPLKPQRGGISGLRLSLGWLPR